jgi:asparagine synthase (glutamine-hydrolysing)
MTLTAVVAAGAEAVVDLERLLSPSRTRKDVHWVHHRGHAVAWTAERAWVSSYDDGDVLVVLDGQLHNVFEPGVAQADLLARRYRQLGQDFARGLLGDFVAIVLDRSRDLLLVCRDPLGVRPWYQARSGPRHSGSTEVATLCALPWVDSGVDEAVAVAFLAGIAQSRGATFHRGVATLPPGSTWRSASEGQRTWRHHQWEIVPEPRLRWDEAVERCRQVVEEAVRCRVQVAGTGTSELSGGLDSSSVVGTAVALGLADLLVGRLVFSGESADERRYSNAVIRQWGLRHVSASPWLPSVDDVREWTAELRRPVPDPNFTMFVALHRAVQREGRSSGLTGLGGDDAFAAAPAELRVVSAFQQRQFADLGRVLRADLRRPREGWEWTLRPTLRHLVGRGRPRPPRYVAPEAVDEHGLGERTAEPVHRLTGIRAVDERADGLTSGYVASILETGAIVADVTGWRSSHPYLDPRVIEATYGLNPWFPVRAGHDRALQVAAFADRLPAEVRDRRDKAEFSEVVRPMAEDEAIWRLLDGPLTDRGWLDADEFAQVLHSARDGKAQAAIPVSRAFALDAWLREDAG